MKSLRLTGSEPETTDWDYFEKELLEELSLSGVEPHFTET